MLLFPRKSPPEISTNLKASPTTALALCNSTEIHSGTGLELEYPGLGRATCSMTDGHISLSQKLSVLTITRVAFCSPLLSPDNC